MSAPAAARYAFACILLLTGSTPAALARSFQTDVPAYLHPRPGAALVSPATSLAFRIPHVTGRKLIALAPDVRVAGSITGQCSVLPVLSDDGETLMLRPLAPFAAGETVRVVLPSLSAAGEPFAYSFTIAHASAAQPHLAEAMSLRDACTPDMEAEQAESPVHDQRAARRTSGSSHLPADFPHVKVAQKTTPSEGNVFINNWGGTPYTMIVDNNGTPLFYRRMPSRARDFKIQPTGLLTYRLGPPYDRFYGMDSTYAVVDTFEAGHGYGTDEHELQMLPNGHVLLIALDYQTVDMSVLVPGGKTNALVIGNHVQEIDAGGNVVFEWRSWDNYAITDAVNVDLTANVIDYVHMNAVSVDDDGNIVVSSRHLSELTKIDRSTGEIIWRLGGKNNQFVLSVSGAAFSWQHDGRALGENRYTVFDNGNWNTPRETRVLEFVLDTMNMTATLAWEYRHLPAFYTWWMGNAQRLPDGHTVIGWADASLPKLTEVTPDGTTVLEMDFVTPAHCYRVFKFPWQGKALVPYLTAEPVPGGVRLLFPVFGDSSAVSYRIYEGTDPAPTTVIDSADVPYAEVTGLSEGTHYFRIRAVRHDGGETAFSNEEEVYVRSFEPGQNMVENGTFDAGTTGWSLGQYDGGVAHLSVSAMGECGLMIDQGGTYVWSVQLLQQNIPLVSGKEYLFRFDARASAPRTIDAKLEQDGGSYLNYSQSSAFYVTTQMQQFEVPFTMREATDYSARVAFNCGQSTDDVFLDNVVVMEVVGTVAEAAGGVQPETFRLHAPFPNPFNPSTEIRFELPQSEEVNVEVFDALGRSVTSAALGRREAGVHSYRWIAAALPSGMYLITMQAGRLRAMQKAILLR